METVKLTFLGTGSAIPTKKHNHVGILASFADENILIDCGEGIQRQFKFAKISPTKLTRILITHWHGDHILGLPGLFQTLAMSNYSKTLKIYGPKGTKRFIQLIQELIFDFHINLEVHEIEHEVGHGIAVNEKNFQIDSAPVPHGTPTLAYSLILKDRIRLDKAKLKKFKLPNSPLLKQLQNGKDIVFNNKKIKASQVVYKEEGKKITFVLDSAFSDKSVALAKDSDILVSESSFSDEAQDKAREYKHLTASDAGKIAKLSKSKKLLLIHLSAKHDNNPNLILKQAKKVFKNVKVMNDFDSITI